MKIFLQPETLNYYRKFKKLSLDNKTRWTSLKRMLKDFLDQYLATGWAEANFLWGGYSK